MDVEFKEDIASYLMLCLEGMKSFQGLRQETKGQKERTLEFCANTVIEPSIASPFDHLLDGPFRRVHVW